MSLARGYQPRTSASHAMVSAIEASGDDSGDDLCTSIIGIPHARLRHDTCGKGRKC